MGVCMLRDTDSFAVIKERKKNLMSCSGRDALAAGYIHQLRLHHPEQVRTEHPGEPS